MLPGWAWFRMPGKLIHRILLQLYKAWQRDYKHLKIIESAYTMQKNILDLTRAGLEAYIVDAGMERYRLDQLITGIYARSYESFEQFSNLPKSFKSMLENDFTLRSFKLADQIQSPHDHTTKFLWTLQDGMKIESVIIYEGKRVTFCISSQVGCALDCKFCATGKMGFLRNLTVGEIVEQVLLMRSKSLLPPTNIVFMGMGEPMLNYEAVLAAADCLADPAGLSFNRKKITISTSGIIKGIQRLADEDRPYSLAISLNSVRQDMRQSIMPISKKYPLKELLDAAQYYYNKVKRRITLEYILIAGLTDSEADARELLKITRQFGCKINLIPCNSDDPNYQPPAPEVVENFHRIINESPRTVTVRNRKGWDIQAACGQLYAENKTRRKPAIHIAEVNFIEDD